MRIYTPEMHGQENECEALVHVLTDPTVEPIMLSYRFLENITNNFSKDLEIGTGGFGVVYMGIVQNMKVAIKKLSRIDDFSEKQFEDELNCLKRVKHRNIVRFLGYCSDTPKEVVEYKGAYVLAECRKRFLCFEYVPNKSLDDYIKDESCQRDWDTCYHLIEGICQGLHYLHNKERINHLDLKPANILLDAGMVPKITDFGLSRRFSGEQSRIITEHVRGTPGYIAPEYIDRGEISFKTDIYSLGVIIRKLLMGRNDDIFDLEGWHKSEEIVCSRANRCIKIAQLCVDVNQQRRPTIDNIIDMLKLKETLKDNQVFSLEQKRSNWIHQLPRMDPGEMHITSKVRSTGSSNLLDIHPRELRFPFKPNEVIICPVSLTNRRDHYLAVWITPTNPEQDIYYGPFKYLLIDPHSTWVVAMKMEKHQEPPRREEEFEVFVFTMGSEVDIGDLRLSLGNNDKEKDPMSIDFWKLVKELGGKVVQVTTLTAVICDTGSHKAGTNKIIRTGKLGGVFSMDVHPTQTWIITGHERGYVSIVNYEAQEEEMALLKMSRESTDPVYSVKFIAQEKWFATGDGHGWVNVYTRTSSGTKKLIKKIRAHDGKPVTSLAVHPTYPYLLTSSKHDNSIELWDWGQGWSCVRTFDGHTAGVGNLTFNRWDIKSFASVGYDNREAKVWNISSSKPVTTIVVPERVENLRTAGASDFLLVASCDSYAYIWDVQRERIHKLGGQGLTICDVASHPTLPILATSSRDGTVCLWDAGTYRLEKIVNDHLPPLGDMVALALTGTEGLTSRVMAGCKDGIAIMDINLPMASSSCVSKFAGDEVQSTVVSALPLESTSNDSTSSDSTSSSNSDDVIEIIQSLELCFPFKPSKRQHNDPTTLTNMTNQYVGAWITLTPVGANSWPVNESLMENPCSFFVMEPNSTWVATVTAEQQKQQPSRDTCKFEMRLIVMGSELHLPDLESPPTNGSDLGIGGGELLKLVEVSEGKLPQAMLMSAIHDPANCKTVTTHQITSAREFGKVVSMDVHPTEPWILAGHKGGGFVSIWNYQTQQRANASKVTASAVFSVKFIVRDQRLAVAAGDAYGSVHIINIDAACSKMNKVRTFEAHSHVSVDSLAVHPTHPFLLSSSREDTRIKLWNWDQGWVCTRIFEGRTWGVRHLAFDPKDINIFASVDKYGSQQVWNINSSTDDPTESFVEPENVDLFFTDRHRHFMIYCDSDDIGSNADIWDLQTKERLQTFPIITQSNLHTNDVRVNGGEIKEKANNGSGEGSPGRAPGGSNHQQSGTTMGGGATSMAMGHPDTSSMPAPGHSGYSIFSDENPNSCSMM